MFWNKWLLRKWKISLSIFGASGNGRVLDSDEWRYLCLYANGKMLTDNLSISLLQSPDVQIFYDYQTSLTWAMGSRVVHHRYKSRFRPESGLGLDKIKISVLKLKIRKNLKIKKIRTFELENLKQLRSKIWKFEKLKI